MNYGRAEYVCDVCQRVVIDLGLRFMSPDPTGGPAFEIHVCRGCCAAGCVNHPVITTTAASEFYYGPLPQ